MSNDHELADQIASFQEGMLPNISVDTLNILTGSTEELVATLYVGDRLRIYPQGKELKRDLKFLRKELPDGEIRFQATTEDMQHWIVTVTDFLLVRDDRTGRVFKENQLREAFVHFTTVGISDHDRIDAGRFRRDALGVGGKSARSAPAVGIRRRAAPGPGTELDRRVAFTIPER